MKCRYIDLNSNYNREYLCEACKLNIYCFKAIYNNIKNNWVSVYFCSKALHHTIKFKEQNGKLTNHEYKRMSDIKFINNKITYSDRGMKLTINESHLLHMLVRQYIDAFKKFIKNNQYNELHKLLQTLC